MFLVSVLRLINTLTLTLCVFVLVAFVWGAIKEKSISSSLRDARKFIDTDLSAVKTVATILVAVSLALSFLLNEGVQQVLGINSIYLKSHGDYCYYIEVKGKAYPAIITIDSDDESGLLRERCFYLKEALLWDGSVHSFEPEENRVDIGKSTYVQDDDYYSFDCVLQNKKASSSRLEEDNDITVINFVFLAVQVLSYVFFLLATAKKHYPKAQGVVITRIKAELYRLEDRYKSSVWSSISDDILATVEKNIKDVMHILEEKKLSPEAYTKQLVYIYCADKAGSGMYHVYRGVLNSSGGDYYSISKSVLKELIEDGVCTETWADEERSTLWSNVQHFG